MIGRGTAQPRKLMLATPSQSGWVHSAYAASIWAIAKDPGVELVQMWQWNEDLVRVRSRAVRKFLQETDGTDLLFVDADISFEPECVRGMIAAQKDIVGAPYPYKRIYWDKVAERGQIGDRTEEELEAAAYDYPYHLASQSKPDATGCATVDAAPLGLCLISRACLMMMTEHYAATLAFQDGEKKTVALFQLLIKDGCLLSEDYSFCHRWRGLGGDVHMYLGPGAPVTHYGMHAFRGAREGLVAP
jgi:hypothetical protein